VERRVEDAVAQIATVADPTPAQVIWSVDGKRGEPDDKQVNRGEVSGEETMVEAKANDVEVPGVSFYDNIFIFSFQSRPTCPGEI